MIDQQLLLIFDNFLRFPIYRLSYSALFMSTTVYYQHAVDMNLRSNFVIHFAVFSYHMYWLLYSGSHLHILVSFYPSLLCLHAFCIFPLQVLQSFILSLHAHLIMVFSEFLQQISGIFHISFYDILLQIFCISVVPILFVIYVLYPDSIYLLLVAI